MFTILQLGFVKKIEAVRDVALSNTFTKHSGLLWPGNSAAITIMDLHLKAEHHLHKFIFKNDHFPLTPKTEQNL